MKRVINFFAIAAVVAVWVSCTGNVSASGAQSVEPSGSSGSSTASVSQNAESRSSESSGSMSGGPQAGTYEFTDELNHTWVMVLDPDGSATLQVKGRDGILYASWNNLKNLGKGYINIVDGRPSVYFPAGEMEHYSIYFRDGFVYDGSSACDAKHPRRRLPVKKIK